MVPVGGLRARLTYDSTYNAISDALTALGWFAGGRQHLPINFVTEPVEDGTEVPLNTLALVAEDMRDEEIELGSLLAEHSRRFFVDFYAENQSVGEHLIFDVRDLLQGRMSSISRGAPTITIMDYTLATPVSISTAEVEFVTVDRAHGFTTAWQKHWYSCAFTLVDSYTDESG